MSAYLARKQRHHPAVVLVFFYLALVLTSCGGQSDSIHNSQDAYLVAVQDAAGRATQDKISKNLIPIIPENRVLDWENGIPGTRVLVASWVTEAVGNSYRCPSEGCKASDTCKEGRECPNYTYDTWVTVVPELKRFFAGVSPEPLRIAQLLGLPPDDAVRKTYLLELWVSPNDLFRPCADPDITTTECPLDYPDDQFLIFSLTLKVYADQACDLNQCGFKDYYRWFVNRRTYLYVSEYPYPWTRLGYTYDWGNSRNHVGLSEFVVHGNTESGKGISVKVNRVVPTANYFNQ
ncbi:MAG: hypothetical protein HQK89_00275 [Nitrospirae bacterium]|nr:hypothetical protein [Nitrospirota bacterium]